MVSSAGNTFGEMHDNGISSVLSTARTETAFLDSPRLRETLRKSDFKLGELKRGAVTVLSLPAGGADAVACQLAADDHRSRHVRVRG